MKASKPLVTSDMHRLIRLVNVFHDLSDDPGRRDAHLLKSLIDLTRARSGFMGVLRVSDGAFVPVCSLYDFGTSAGPRDELDCYLTTLLPENRALTDTIRKARAREDEVYTQTRRQAVGDSAWYASEHVRAFRRPLGIDDVIVSVSLVLPDEMSVLVIDRGAEEGEFSDAEHRVVNLLHSEIGWLFRQQIASPDFRRAELRARLTKGPRDEKGASRGLRDAS